MKKYLIILFVFTSLFGFTQNPVVPSTMYFGDIELKINSAAQKKIQSHVDNYRRSPTYFQKKIELAKLYFPIIEAKFKEENVPVDFKYLIIQESGFVSDAVSSSNAVGYWQFKEATAKEVGLIVNSQVDERKNISASSTGAAKYFKSNNMYFSNWIYALQAYNQGAGGTQKDSDPKYYGSKKMDITAKTHWYVLKFLAHKIAYENEVNGESDLGFYLEEFKSSGQSLKEIAKKENIELTRFENYNKWLYSSKTPTDKDYIVLLTKDGKGISRTLPNEENDKIQIPTVSNVKIDLAKKEVKINSTSGIPDVTIKMGKNADKQAEYLKKHPHIFTRLNGLNAIKSIEGDTKDVLALAGGISTKNFLKYNDIRSYDKIIANQFYYLQNKRNRAKAHYHSVNWNETLWGISQDYGIHVKAIEKKNRLEKLHKLKAGRVLWFSKTIPKNEKVKFEDPGPKPIPKKEFEKNVELPKQDEKLKEEVKEIIKEGVVHNSDEIPDKTVAEEVRDDMGNAGIENIVIEESVVQDDVVETENNVLMHTVKQGETLYGISKKYKVSVDDIVKWNRIKDQSVSVDQMLIVGIKSVEIVQPIKNENIHIVSIGETMYSISKQYGVKVEDILKWNNKDDNSISEGDRLKIIK